MASGTAVAPVAPAAETGAASSCSGHLWRDLFFHFLVEASMTIGLRFRKAKIVVLHSRQLWGLSCVFSPMGFGSCASHTTSMLLTTQAHSLHLLCSSGLASAAASSESESCDPGGSSHPGRCSFRASRKGAPCTLGCAAALGSPIRSLRAAASRNQR